MNVQGRQHKVVLLDQSINVNERKDEALGAACRKSGNSVIDKPSMA